MLKNRSEFLKNMLTLLSGSALAQLIPFLVLPILQKWFYTPAQFGELALYTSVSMLLAQVAGFKYEFAIVKAEKQSDAENLLVGAMSITVLVSLTALLFFNFFPDFAGRLFGVTAINRYFILIPFSIFLFSSFEILNYWHNRKKFYKYIATGKVVKTLTAETTKLTFGIEKINNMGLIIGRVIGEFWSFSFMFYSFIKHDRKTFNLRSSKEILHTLRKFYHFPAFTMPSVFIGNLINLVFIGLFTKYFGTSQAGIIGISVVYVVTAFGLISQSFSQVFYKKLSDTKGRKALRSLYLGNAKYLLLISIAAVIFVQLIPLEWVVLILGDKWSELLPTLKILVYSYAITFITSSLSFIYMRLNRQKQMLIFDLIHLIMVAGAIYGGFHYFGTFKATLISYTIAQIIFYSFTFALAIIFIEKSEE